MHSILTTPMSTHAQFIEACALDKVDDDQGDALTSRLGLAISRLVAVANMPVAPYWDQTRALLDNGRSHSSRNRY